MERSKTVGDKRVPLTLEQLGEMQPNRRPCIMQQSFVESDTLPTDFYERVIDGYGYDGRAILEAAGVKFLGIVEGYDGLLQYVELPTGWRKVAGGHTPIFSDLIDDQGRRRALITYDALFHCYIVQICLIHRFRVDIDIKFPGEEYGDYKELIVIARVMDCGNVIYSADPISGRGGRGELEYRATQAAISWLNKNYPNWQDPSAYWD